MSNIAPADGNGQSKRLIVAGLSLVGFPLLAFMAIGVCVFLATNVLKPSFDGLKEDCSSAVKADPTIKGVESWLTSRQISYRKEKTPSTAGGYSGHHTDGVLYNLWQLGVKKDDVDRSTTCISFYGYAVGWGASARGLFIFAEDGSLIDYRLHRDNHPL